MVERKAEESKTLQQLKNEEEIFWLNPRLKEADEANNEADYAFTDIQDAEDRLRRFAPFIEMVYPETKERHGILESDITAIPKMQDWLGEVYETELPGNFLIK